MKRINSLCLALLLLATPLVTSARRVTTPQQLNCLHVASDQYHDQVRQIEEQRFQKIFAAVEQEKSAFGAAYQILDDKQRRSALRAAEKQLSSQVKEANKTSSRLGKEARKAFSAAQNQCNTQHSADCGNDICETGEQNVCARDCSTTNTTNSCGNGVCNSNETPASCPVDCGSTFPRCGDGLCQTNEPNTCPQDCLSNVQRCGDGLCTGTENPTNCAYDCVPPPHCNDGICTGNESQTCPLDCQTAQCGDWVCQANETHTCPQDCQTGNNFCGDGVCRDGENGNTCAIDCSCPSTACTDVQTCNSVGGSCASEYACGVGGSCCCRIQ